MPRDPRVEKLQRLRDERSTRAAGGYYGTRATAGGNVAAGPRRRDTGRTLLSLVLLVAIVCGGLYGAGQYLVHGVRPATAAQGRTVTFVVKPGESVPALADRLQADGLIFNATVFHWYLRLTGTGNAIQAGPHTLHTGMTMDDVVRALSTAPPAAPTAIVTIFPGWRAEQVAAALAKAGVASYQSVMNEVLRGSFSYPFLADRPLGASLEGYLMPDTYTFLLHRGAHYALGVMLRNFGRKVSAATQQRAKALYGSFYKAVIAASLVEREAGTNHDRYLIASVFANRLFHDPSGQFAHLNSDPTIQYAVNHAPNWWAPIANTSINSKFNTYQITGLPPQPIAEPSVSSIQAAANPPHTNYYYFYHVNGSHGKSIFCTAQQGAQCPNGTLE